MRKRVNRTARRRSTRTRIIVFLIAIACLCIPTDLSITARPSSAQSPEVPIVPDSQDAVTRLLPSALPLTNPISTQVQTESIAIAPIYLDGRTLFQLGAPAVENTADNPRNGPNAAEIRAQEIQPRLYRIAQEQIAQKQTDSPDPISITIDQASQLPIISVGDEHLLTVTTLDAQQNGYVDRNEYAIALRATIETGLDRYQLERQPAFLKQQAKIAVGIIGTALFMFLGSKRIEKRLRARQTRLANTNTQLGRATANTQPPMASAVTNGNIANRVSPNSNGVDVVFDLLKAKLDNRQKRKLNELAAGILLLSQLGLLGGSVLWILWLFPYSRWLTTVLSYWISVPAKILLIAGLAYLALRIISLAVDKTFLALQEGTQWAPESSERLNLRLLTFSQVTKGVAGAAVFGLMILAMLSIAGVEVGPILAGAGIIGVGISLAAQSLIKDIINGFLILFEDQFGVGDVIAIGDLSGSVEAINLRVTQLRNTEGRLITIPNSQINIVQNLSKDWSQVDLSVSVEPSTDLSEAMLILKETALSMAKDSHWQKFILEPPDLLGVEAIDSSGITLRLLLKTQPLKQWVVARELRAQLKQAFDRAGISTGVPKERLEIRWDNFANDAHNLKDIAEVPSTSEESHPPEIPT